MTPEELKRKVEFIVEVQAQTSVALDILAAEHAEFEGWSRNALKQLAVDHQRMVELIQIESAPLERSEQRLERAELEDRARKNVTKSS